MKNIDQLPDNDERLPRRQVLDITMQMSALALFVHFSNTQGCGGNAPNQQSTEAPIVSGRKARDIAYNYGNSISRRAVSTEGLQEIIEQYPNWFDAQKQETLHAIGLENLSAHIAQRREDLVLAAHNRFHSEYCHRERHGTEMNPTEIREHMRFILQQVIREEMMDAIKAYR